MFEGRNVLKIEGMRQYTKGNRRCTMCCGIVVLWSGQRNVMLSCVANSQFEKSSPHQKVVSIGR